MSEQSTGPDTVVATEKQLIVEAIAGVWWILLLRGVLLVLMGGYALFQPAMTAVALTQVIGIFVIADGVVAIIAALLGWRDSALWTIVRGILAILVGMFVISHSMIIAGITATVVMIILAIHSIAAGILEIVVAIRHRKEIEGGIWFILSGVLSIIFGLILASVPLMAIGVFIRVLGIYVIIFGISMIALAFQTKGLVKALKNA